MALIACVGLIALPSFAQNPTGTLTGRVTADGEALPGVTVKISSDALPGGSQIAVTGASGDYLFRFLPGGTYAVTFTLEGFHTLESSVKISVAQTRQLDAEMALSAVSEEIEVTSSYETVTTSSQASVTYEQDLIERLPIARDIFQTTTLAPGVAANAGHVNAVNIAGQPGPQSLFMVNGVVVNDPVWGNAYSLYIEDAIEETTVGVSGVSAEYGRFTGGVINMVTKSGGNEFSGSYRLSLDNEDWEAKTPLTTSKEDKVNQTHEATLGGYLMKDHIWFFLAGRARDRDQQDQMYDDTPFLYTRSQQRYEGKLTLAPHISHRLLGSYMKVDDKETGYARLTVVEPSALIDRTTPQEMYALNYTGVVRDNLFLEGQYSKRDFTFAYAAGAAQDDLANGTTLLYYVGPVYMGGHHLFCGSQCEGGDEQRNNEDLLLKASLFLSSDRAGSHDIVVGYDSYADLVTNNNYQSPSNFVFYRFAPPQDNVDGVHYPVIMGDYSEIIGYWPILQLSRGTDFVTDSLFVNDTWRLNQHLTFNLGLRYDQNDGRDGSGNQVTDDARLSPRLGVSWDLKGDGEWIVNASYSSYVASIDSGEAGRAGGGAASDLFYYYLGPSINVDENGNFAPQHTTPEAMQIVFDWFDSIGGLQATDYWVWAPEISGVNLEIPSLSSPYTDEVSVGFTKRLGNRGVVRADYVWREGHDFYMDRKDMSTGQITWSGEVAPGVPVTQDFDLTIRENDNSVLSRTYHGLHAQFQYRFGDRLLVGGNWTWSHLYGNFAGENINNGISVGSALDQPEYRQASWNYPEGDLAQDQRHRVRAYAIWDVVSSRRQNLSLSWLENFWSGTPYSASQLVPVSPFVENPGYITAPSTNTYYFSGRGGYTTDEIHRTDLSVNYSFFVKAFGGSVELYIQPEVLNVFNESGAVAVETTTYSAYNDPSLAVFDPFTETPVQGVNWDVGDDFGQPAVEDDYQVPRTFRLSVGVRF